MLSDWAVQQSEFHLQGSFLLFPLLPAYFVQLLPDVAAQCRVRRAYRQLLLPEKAVLPKFLFVLKNARDRVPFPAIVWLDRFSGLPMRLPRPLQERPGFVPSASRVRRFLSPIPAP